MVNFIDIIIKLLCYFGAFIGLLLFLSPMKTFKTINASRFRKVKSKEYKKKNIFISYISRLIRVTLNVQNEAIAYNFIIYSIAFGLIIFLVLFSRSISIVLNLGISIFASILPYLVLLTKLRNLRIEGSYEGVTLVKELMNQYKINYLNMTEAIDCTVANLKNSPYCQRALFRLSSSLKEYKNDSELTEIIDDFIFSINTEWATLIGMNIYLAINDGVDVRESLEDIIEELKLIKIIMEEDKRENIESFKMIKYVVPFSYVGSIYLSIHLFDFTFVKFLNYQFKNSYATILGTITLSLMAINFIIFNMLRKPKYDY